jgi:hypothetical protein
MRQIVPLLLTTLNEDLLLIVRVGLLTPMAKGVHFLKS